MSKDKLNNMIGFSDFKPNWKAEEAKPTKRTETGLDILKEEKEPKYTMLGPEKTEPTNPLFGYAAVRDQQIKKIGSFTSFTKMKDPATPKERPILNAGIFIQTEDVRGYINRIEGNRVFVESLDEPMKIVEIKLKDAVKLSKENKEEIKKFNEDVTIPEDINPEIQRIKVEDLYKMHTEGKNIWLVAVEGSGAGVVRYNPEIQVVQPTELLDEVTDENTVVVMIDDDGFDSVPASIRNKCSLAILESDFPISVRNRIRLFRLE